MNPYSLCLIATWALTPAAWSVLWIALGVLSVLLVVLLHTRWVRTRTWRKCAILSLWVHILLAFAATTIRVVVGAPESGDDQPIRVTVHAPASEMHEPEQEKVTPVWDQIAAPSLIPPLAEPLEPPRPSEDSEGPDAASLRELRDKVLASNVPSPAPPFDAPELLEPARSERASADPETTQQDSQNSDSDSFHDASATAAATGNERGEPPAAGEPSPHTEPVEATQVTTLPTVTAPPSAPADYADRFADDREQTTSKRGGSEQTERAVQSALGWLAKTQSRDGGWDASKYGAGQERVVLGHNRRGAGAQADTGVTGLSLLAFLGNGNTHQHGSYRVQVANALEYLRQRQRADGSLYGDAELFARTYCHSMATFAVCEAYAMTRDERIGPMARAAVRYSLHLQHPTDGGWRYRRGDTGDTSQLGWQMMSLKSAELAGIEIPPVTWSRIERFLRRVRRGTAGGLAAYRPEGPASRTMTAEGWYCRQLLGEDRGGEIGSAATAEATTSLLEELPEPAGRNLYYWYYATLALQQNHQASAEAMEAWETWNHALTSTLLTTQSEDGSWSEDTLWGGYGGRVYTTSLSAMCLEVYYRYRLPGDPGEIADGRDRRFLAR